MNANPKRYEILVGEKEWIDLENERQGNEEVTEASQTKTRRQRLSTKHGHALCSESAREEIENSERNAQEKEEKKKKNNEKKATQKVAEQPLYELLQQLNYCPPEKKKLTLNHMKEFAKRNNINFNASSSREVLVSHLLEVIAGPIATWIPNTNEHNQNEDGSGSGDGVQVGGEGRDRGGSGGNGIGGAAGGGSGGGSRNQREAVSAYNGVVLCECLQMLFMQFVNPMTLGVHVLGSAITGVPQIDVTSSGGTTICWQHTQITLGVSLWYGIMKLQLTLSMQHLSRPEAALHSQPLCWIIDSLMIRLLVS